MSKVITGGAGVWGNHYMNAHPQLSKDNVTTIVKYILSLSQQRVYDSLPASGTAAIKPPPGAKNGTWALTASYTDMGNNVVPLNASQQLALRGRTIHAVDADLMNGDQQYQNMLGMSKSGAYLVLKGIDLKGIRKVTYRYASKDNAAIIEIHTDSLKGPIVSSLSYQPTGDWNKQKEVSAILKGDSEKHDLYFIIKKEGAVVGEGLCLLDWVRFGE